MRKLIFFLLIVSGLVSCKRNPMKVDVSNISIHLKIKHLDADLLNLKADEIATAIPSLKNSYGDFFDIFTYQMIAIGGTDQSNFTQMLNSFITDTIVQQAKASVAQNIDTLRFRKELETAFKHYKYYFPEKEIPAIYTCISGFNQSIVVAQNLLGVSLDNYLGSQSQFYEKLGLPAYKRRNMRSEKLVPEIMQAWADTEWPRPDKENTLFSNMIQQGKVLYFLDAMFPEMNDTLKIGYTEKQMVFCRKNETKMWTYLAEHKMLFTTDRMSIKRFIDDAPYTASFSEESPGRSGAWIGWQIVRAYMKSHPEVKLPNLMNNPNFQEILNQSGYQP
jgi:gliding motility-associated lipoprotein GldB